MSPADSRFPTTRPSLVVFDVNETLSDLGPLRLRFEALGAPGSLAGTWFAAVLRDGFALATTGRAAPFADIGRDLLRSMLPREHLAVGLDDAVDDIMAAFLALEVHPDVVPGVEALHLLGVRLVTLSNGASTVAESLLTRAGVADRFEALLSVEDAGIWKPARPAYEHALRTCGVDAGEAMLVAVHPWDLHGAATAGLRTGWLDRAGVPYPSYFRVPEVTASTLTELAERLGAAPA